jgi:hypothetical protein
MTGKRFYPLNPNPDDIDIRDIAYVLSGEYRFGGHCKPRITVAQHSVMVSWHVSDENALWGLLHDASEAYVRDLNRPIKLQIPEYKEIENRILRAVATRYLLPWPMPAEIHDIDNRVGIAEARRCMTPLQPGVTFDGAEPLQIRIAPWSTYRAEEEFLHRFGDLSLIYHAKDGVHHARTTAETV